MNEKDTKEREWGSVMLIFLAIPIFFVGFFVISMDFLLMSEVYEEKSSWDLDDEIGTIIFYVLINGLLAGLILLFIRKSRKWNINWKKWEFPEDM